MKASDIRELLKLTKDPEIISFAGGLPNPETFPREELEKACSQVLKEDYVKALQYGTTEGLDELRTEISKYLNKNHDAGINFDDLVITTGAQEAIDLVSKVFVDPGDLVVVENPTYLAALSSFRMYQARFKGVPMDDKGMKIDEFEKTVKQEKPCLVYLVPTFQNPSGVTMTLERRKHLMEVASDHDLLIVEDNPYGDLRYSGQDVPSLLSLDKEGRVLYLGTMSKLMCPGLRIGWIATKNKEMLNKLVLAKQPTDLCSSTLAQYLAAKYMEQGTFYEHIEEIKELYKRKRDLMIKTMEEEFPENVSFTRPEGGMFLWVTFPEGVDCRELMAKAVKEEKVAFVPGDAFDVEGKTKNTGRINYSYSSDEQIVEGVKRLARLLK
jgi:2-aminoadipate transaminase